MTTSLRQRMTEDMQIRNLSPLTQSCYVQQVSMFARHFGKSPAVLGLEDIRDYELDLTNQKKLDASSIQVAVSALRFLYRVTLKRPWDFIEAAPSPKKPRSLPIILSPEEVVHFLGCVANSSACRRWSRCPRQRTRTIATSTKNSLASRSASALLAARPYGVAPRPSAVHPGSIDHRHVMTTQQALPTASAPR